MPVFGRTKKYFKSLNHSVGSRNERRVRRFSVAFILSIAWGLSGFASRADLVSPYGGETAPNFVEISVLDDRVRIALEIDPADYPFFVGSDDGSGQSLSERTGDTMAVAADGVPLAPAVRRVDIRPRKPRITAATPIVKPRLRSSEVIYAELEYPFAGHPETFTFTPPVDDDGMPLASLGVLVEHMGVPVTDYRYLSRSETLMPDWDDPWFSAFENPNLTRHHKAPLMSFLSMEPREVRHEIIFRLRDLEDWIDLGLGNARALTPEQMAMVRDRAAAFFSDRNPVTIDGQQVRPDATRVSQIAVGVEGLRVLEGVGATDRATALLGIVLSYARRGMAREVTMTWQLFPPGVDRVPVTLTDVAGGLPGEVRAGDPTVRWVNSLKRWEEPVSQRVHVPTSRIVSLPFLSICLGLVGFIALRAVFRTRAVARFAATTAAGVAVAGAVAAIPVVAKFSLPGGDTPDPDAARAVMAGLLDNARTAMLETQPEGFKEALAPFVPADRMADVGSELRRGLSVNLPSGAIARIDDIVDLKVEEVTRTTGGSQILASWTAEVSGGHWGHLHRRAITYRGLLDVSRANGDWYLNGLTILAAQTGA